MVVLVAKQFNMKTAVVTGGSQGIGLAIAKKFISLNYNVITVSRASGFQIGDPRHQHIAADLSQWKECQRFTELVKAGCKELHVLVNNVGKSQWASIPSVTEELVDELYDLNVKSYIAVTQGLVVLMKEGASIINISSMAGKRGTKNNSVYCATKFAVNGLTQSWAKELGERGIRVNAVCPVLVESQGLFDALMMRDAPAEKMSVAQFMADFSKSQSALGFLPLAGDVAEFCASLIENRALSGQCINLDCGVFPQ